MKPNIRTLNTFKDCELARLVMGTIFLVIIYIYLYIIFIYVRLFLIPIRA